MSTIWGNVDGFVDQYRCATTLYLSSMLAHAYNIITYLGVGALVHAREFVRALNFTNKQFLNVNYKCETYW